MHQISFKAIPAGEIRRASVDSKTLRYLSGPPSTQVNFITPTNIDYEIVMLRGEQINIPGGVHSFEVKNIWDHIETFTFDSHGDLDLKALGAIPTNTPKIEYEFRDTLRFDDMASVRAGMAVLSNDFASGKRFKIWGVNFGQIYTSALEAIHLSVHTNFTQAFPGSGSKYFPLVEFGLVNLNSALRTATPINKSFTGATISDGIIVAGYYSAGTQWPVTTFGNQPNHSTLTSRGTGGAFELREPITVDPGWSLCLYNLGSVGIDHYCANVHWTEGDLP